MLGEKIDQILKCLAYLNIASSSSVRLKTTALSAKKKKRKKKEQKLSHNSRPNEKRKRMKAASNLPWIKCASLL